MRNSFERYNLHSCGLQRKRIRWDFSKTNEKNQSPDLGNSVNPKTEKLPRNHTYARQSLTTKKQRKKPQIQKILKGNKKRGEKALSKKQKQVFKKLFNRNEDVKDMLKVSLKWWRQYVHVHTHTHTHTTHTHLLNL